MGLGRSAWDDWPSPIRARFGAPFALGVRLFIASSSVRRHIEQIILLTSFTRKPPPQDEGELDELVARINVGGGKEARGGLQAAGLGVFPSFIAAIFIDDVLRSLHHPYVPQSV
jgi:hypothetical protein